MQNGCTRQSTMGCTAAASPPSRRPTRKLRSELLSRLHNLCPEIPPQSPPNNGLHVCYALRAGQLPRAPGVAVREPS